MPLTDRSIRALKPGPKPRKVSDGAGLYVLVHPNGGRYWRLKYRIDGKEKLLSLGTFPDVGLAQARTRRDEARRQLADGIDPGAVRKAERGGERDSLEAVAVEWLEKQTPGWAPGHAQRVRGRIEADVLPVLGHRPVSELGAPEILAALRRVVDRGAIETAHRELQYIGQILRFAVATGRASSDPTAALRGALPAARGGHFAAITAPAELGALLRAIADYAGSHVVRCALAIAPHVFVRPGELRRAEWAEINLTEAIWTIPAVKMKGGRDHLVPLSRQSIAILRDLEQLTGRGRYAFPSPRTGDRPMSENGVTAALRRMGYDRGTMTGHGFRAIARTLLDEELGFAAHLIEHQLAHRVKDPLGRSYNRTQHLRERVAMMQKWSDYLDTLRDGGKVVPFERRAER